MSHDLRAAALKALEISRKTCRAFALGYSHENAAKQFLSNVSEAFYRPLHQRAA